MFDVVPLAGDGRHQSPPDQSLAGPDHNICGPTENMVILLEIGMVIRQFKTTHQLGWPFDGSKAEAEPTITMAPMFE